LSCGYGWRGGGDRALSCGGWHCAFARVSCDPLAGAYRDRTSQPLD
jgi:hypothetical protein